MTQTAIIIDDVEFSRVPAKTGFSYASIDADLADRLRRKAEGIRQRVAGQTAAMIETGRELASIKEEAGHGTFQAWVEAECGITPRMAQMYMRAVEWADKNAKLISHLQPTAVLKLSAPSTPETVTATIAERVEQGASVSIKVVDRLVHKARDERHEQERLAKEAAVPKRTREARKARQEREERERQDFKRRQEEAEQRAATETVELASLLLRYIRRTDLQRVKELLLNTDVTRRYFESGEWHVRIVDKIEEQEEAEQHRIRAYQDHNAIKIVDARAELTIAKRQGNLGRAAELTYQVIPQLEGRVPQYDENPDEIPDFYRPAHQDDVASA